MLSDRYLSAYKRFISLMSMFCQLNWDYIYILLKLRGQLKDRARSSETDFWNLLNPKPHWLNRILGLNLIHRLGNEFCLSSLQQ